MKEALPFRRDALRRGGFTLIEVAIALVIFIFGALAIVRIFPPALGVIQNSGDQLTAVNFNRSLLARYTRQPELVPDWITEYGSDGATSNWQEDVANSGVGIVGAINGPPRRNKSLPINNVQDFDKSALGHFRQIYGERHIVPANEIVLTQFPIRLDASNATTLKLYTEDVLEGVKLNNTGVIDMSQATKSDGTPYTTGGNRFYISYRWIEGGKIWKVNDEPQATLSGSVSQAGRSGVSIVPGEVRVRVKTLASPTNIDNDRGAFVAVGMAGRTVCLDYAVKDWRWLVQDSIPSMMPEPDEAPPTMVKARSVNLPVRPLDDTTSPFIYTLFSSQYPTLPTSSQFEPKVKKGQVIFDVSSIGTDTPNTRIVYRSLDNWALQLSVAARDYLLNFDTVPSAIEPWRDCVLVRASDRTLLYFLPSEAGKSILISYSYNDSSGNKEIDSRIFNIRDEIVDLPTAIAIGGRVSVLELTNNKGDALPSTTPVTAIREIRGMSVQSRTAWLDGNRFDQASAVGFRTGDNG